jgi:phosphoribosylformylglycinamidine synthase
MAFAGGFGLELDLCKLPSKGLERNDTVLFSESNSRFLMEVSEQDKREFEALMKGKGCAQIGEVTESQKLCIHGLNRKVIVDALLSELRHSWKKTLSGEP